MLIPVRHLKHYWKLEPRGTLHVGAHLGEEQVEYKRYGFEPIIWIEAQSELAQALKRKITPPSIVIQALAWNKTGENLSLKITNNGQSSSVFELGSHKIDYPDVTVTESRSLVTARLDSIVPKDFQTTFLNLDIQGAEYEALQGLGDLLDEFDYVYSEVSKAQVYAGIKQVSEIDDYLKMFGFVRVATKWTPANWGDALYLKRNWAEAKFGSNLGLNIRIAVYWIWLQWFSSSFGAFVSNAISTVSSFSRNKSQ